MTIEEVLRAQLITGSRTYGSRVYPVRAPQNPTYPFLTYAEISEVVTHAMGADPNVILGRWQVSAFGLTYLATKAAKNDAIAALSRYRATVSGLEVFDVFKELEMDQPFDFEALAYHTVVDFLVMHRN